MFLNLIINAIIWIAICKMSFICAKFTTIAQYGWFQDAFFALENFAQYRLKREKLAQMVLNFSYSKAFYCRPCHSFWISLHLIYFWFRFTKIHLMPIDIFLICALSYLIYFIWKSYEALKDAEKQNKGTITGTAVQSE